VVIALFKWLSFWVVLLFSVCWFAVSLLLPSLVVVCHLILSMSMASCASPGFSFPGLNHHSFPLVLSSLGLLSGSCCLLPLPLQCMLSWSLCLPDALCFGSYPRHCCLILCLSSGLVLFLLLLPVCCQWL